MEKGAIIKNNPEKNPKTGDWRYMSPKVDEKKCTACGTCVKFCPEATIELINISEQETGNNKSKKKLPARIATRSVADVDYDFCKGCGVCAAVCPMKAIIMKKE